MPIILFFIDAGQMKHYRVFSEDFNRNFLIFRNDKRMRIEWRYIYSDGSTGNWFLSEFSSIAELKAGCNDLREIEL